MILPYTTDDRIYTGAVIPTADATTAFNDCEIKGKKGIADWEL